eukprot:TRINITY_DN1472_c0_g2_i1.p1 TRINITY_DN1472_c0_g2~~TRINITY_DN1472_c0_g2_i1.p1  ORF type:complete len:1451 (-),score=404.43 TRINITY_DN1472_c0_g2_i1:87-4439(-)
MDLDYQKLQLNIDDYQMMDTTPNLMPSKNYVEEETVESYETSASLGNLSNLFINNSNSNEETDTDNDNDTTTEDYSQDPQSEKNSYSGLLEQYSFKVDMDEEEYATFDSKDIYLIKNNIAKENNESNNNKDNNNNRSKNTYLMNNYYNKCINLTSYSDNNNYSNNNNSENKNNGGNNSQPNKENDVAFESLMRIQKILLDSDGRNWNEEFQQLLENPTTTPEEMQERINSISEFTNEFLQKAIPLAKQIISERFLPNHEKKITSSLIGGIAGGEKFFVEGMFWKFSTTDNHGIYGNDSECAMKTANHELRSFKEIISCNIPNLHLPLMATITWLGCRLSVQTIVPLSKGTLIYGSADAGRTVHNDDPKFSELMNEMGKKLNLKPHHVGKSGTKVLVSTPCDIEGHLAMDGRYYVLDVARLFPPSSPTRDKKGEHLFRLLRPEFLRKYLKPLSSDAFSAFGSDNIKENNLEVIEATKYLFKELIPNFAQDLNRRYSNSSTELLSNNLIEEIHSVGINCRYLGLLRKKLIPEIDVVVLTEMLVRTANKILLKKMREVNVQIPSIKPYKEVTAEYYNLLFGNGESSEEYWFGEFKRRTLEKFIFSFATEEASPSFDLRSVIDLKNMFIKLTQKNNVVFTKAAVVKLNKSLRDRTGSVLKIYQTLFTHDDVQEINPAIKVIKIDPIFQNFTKNGEIEMVYKKKLELREKSLKKGDPHIFDSMRHLAEYYEMEGRYEESHQIYQKIIEKVTEDMEDDEMGIKELKLSESHQNLGQLAQKFGKYEEALNHFNISHKIIRKMAQLKVSDPSFYQRNDLHIATCLCKMSQLKLSLGELRDSEIDIIESCSIYEKWYEFVNETSMSNALSLSSSWSHTNNDVLLPKITSGIVESYNTRSLVKYNQGKYKDAQHWQKESLRITNTNFGKINSRYAACVSGYAKIMYRLGKYDKAKKNFDKSLKIRKECLGKHPLVAVSYSDVAYLYGAQGQFQQALKIYNKAIRLLTSIFGEKNPHPTIESVKKNIAWIYFKLANFSKAEELYLSALKEEQKTLGSQHPTTAYTLSELSEVYIKSGNFSQAKELVIKALTIRKNIYGELHIEVARSVANLGLVYFHEGNYAQSETLLKQSRQMMTNALRKSDHINNSFILCGLGQNYMRQGNYSKAIKILDKSLKISVDSLGKSHPDTANIINLKAYAFGSLGEITNAKKLYKEALLNLENFFGSDHMDIAIVKKNLAWIHVSNSNFEKAKSLYEDSLRMALKIVGENHPETSLIKMDFAEFLLKQNKIKESKKLAKKVLETQKQIYKNTGHHINIGNSYNLLGFIYTKQSTEKPEKLDKAIESHKLALQQIKKSINETHERVGKTKHYLSKVYLQKGDHEQALKHLKSAFQILYKFYGEKLVIAQLYCELGDLCSKMNEKKEKIVFYYEKSLDIYLSGLKYAKTHPDVDKIFEIIKNFK